MPENPPGWDPEYLVRLARAAMPFGKYAGRPLSSLPEPYLAWFARTGFPEGELGGMLSSMLEIKTNGLEHLLFPLR